LRIAAIAYVWLRFGRLGADFGGKAAKISTEYVMWGVSITFFVQPAAQRAGHQVTLGWARSRMACPSLRASSIG
jgi:hypothetical protein